MVEKRKGSFDLNQKDVRFLKAKEEMGRRGDPRIWVMRKKVLPH